MKNVIFILGILTTVMVYGVVAGPSLDAAPVIDMDLTETQCRVCHSDVDVLRNTNHNASHTIDPEEKPDPLDCIGTDCHIQSEPKKLDCMDLECHNASVTDHHDFIDVFDIEDGDIYNYDLDCSICHEKGVPRPLDK